MRCKESNEDLDINLAKLWRFDSNLVASRSLNNRFIKAICAATSSFISYMTSKNILTVIESLPIRE